jgi:hypothetical protein
MVAFAVSGEDVPDVEIWKVEEVAEILFVFIAVEATARTAPVGFNLGLVGGE